MAEYTEEDLDVGRHVADRLNYPSFRGHMVDNFGFPLDDISEQYNSFDRDQNMVARLGMSRIPAFPVKWSEHYVTIALSEYHPFRRPRYFPGEQYSSESDFVRALSPEGIEGWAYAIGAEMINIRDAINSFLALVAEFVAFRRAGVRELSQSGRTQTVLHMATHSTPGCMFAVHTASMGLRAHWSGAYRISANYFGAPTSPTSSALQSGSYIFGVDGGAYTTIQWDTATKITLPGPHSSITLNY